MPTLPTYSVTIRFGETTRQPSTAEVNALARERGVSVERVPFLDKRGVLLRIEHPSSWRECQVAVVVDALRKLYRR